MTQKVILTVGPTCAGKTTWAEEQVRLAPTKFVNLNRDDFRFSLYGARNWSEYKFNKRNEDIVGRAIKDAARAAIDASRSVIISDTNMSESVQAEWKTFADEQGCDFELQYFAPGLLKTILERNRYKGPRSLPEHVVKQQYDRYINFYAGGRQYVRDESKPKCVLFDIDGTLMDNSGRGPFDWSKVMQDTVRESIRELFNMYRDRGYLCITVSGRDGVSEEATLESLRINGIVPSAHFQRAAGDGRSDDIVKEEILFEKIAPHYCVQRAIDDRTQVVDMWRRIGVECWQVAPGDF
ncbi:polynucleotide kinase [Aeromonas phage Asfd_1]|nr:polynucleotide kinase [Aeromonas phage Asfd_1]